MRNLFMKLCLCMVIISGAYKGHAQSFAGGTGVSGDPFLIQTVRQLAEVRNYVGIENQEVYFKLGQNIALTGNWIPIGALSAENAANAISEGFYGKFDGNGYEITGLQTASKWGVGLFGYICEGALIENLTLRTIETGVLATNRSGILAAANGRADYANYAGGTITNCRVYGKISGAQTIGALVGRNAGVVTNCQAIDVEVVGTGGEIGGLIGANDANYTMMNCSVSGKITGVAHTGGLIGINRNGVDTAEIIDCSTDVIISSSGAQAGGLIGNNQAKGGLNGCSAVSVITITADVANHGGLVGYHNAASASIKNCWVKTSISGGYKVGGLIGLTAGSFAALIENCSAITKINSASNTGNGEFGGLIGRTETGSSNLIRNCWALVDITANKRIGGLAGNLLSSIENCYALGCITSTDATSAAQVGGLAGYTSSGTMTNSYAAVSISSVAGSVGKFDAIAGMISSGGARSGVYFNNELATSGWSGTSGLSAAKMKQVASFTNFTFLNNPWNIDESISYPYLRSTDTEVDFISTTGVSVSSAATKLPERFDAFVYDESGVEIELESIAIEGNTWKGNFVPGSVAAGDFVYIVTTEGGNATCMLSVVGNSGAYLVEGEVTTPLDKADLNGKSDIKLIGDITNEDIVILNAANLTSIDLEKASSIAGGLEPINKNCLVYAGEDYQVRNVVVNGVAQTILLEDGFPFSNIKDFKAENITYKRVYPQAGWASLILPFTVIKPAGTNAKVFSGSDGTTVNFADAGDVLLANVPHVISVAGNPEPLSYTATGEIDVRATINLAGVNPDGNEFSFMGTYTVIPGVYADKTLYFLQSDGSGFGKGVEGSSVPAFRAYIQGPHVADPERFFILGNKGEVTNIKEDMIGDGLNFYSENGLLEITADKDQVINIYAVDGRLIRSLDLHKGSNSFNITSGIYLVNKRKVIVR